ncbi:MAG TPA: type II toxin-antitoxin system RelE/ParE family toxin [bacterium]|nr:type II toxin-antitoxin system RelE/ParE family toxin [bacterium]
MRREFEVQWSPAARNDLITIAKYIAADRPHNALNVFNTIKSKASSLKVFPERGRIIPELRDQDIPLHRELVISPWRIIYRISENKVYVLAVLDSRRNIEDLLLQRLTDPKS